LYQDKKKSGDGIQNVENGSSVDVKVPSGGEFWAILRNTFSKSTHIIFRESGVNKANLHLVNVEKQLLEFLFNRVAPYYQSEDSNLENRVKRESQDLQDLPRIPAERQHARPFAFGVEGRGGHSL
jgi:hypothetical protein